MIDYSVLTKILIGEAVVLGGLGVLIVFHRFFRVALDEKIARKKDEFANFYISLIESKKPFNPQEHPRIGLRKKLLLQVIEDFDKRIGGEQWHVIRKSAVDAFLLGPARRYTNSIFWLRRNFAARVFVLQSYPEDEPLILKLMDDKKFLVRNPASIAAVYRDSWEGVLKIFMAIKTEPGFSQFIYLDTLIRSSEKVFTYILEVAKDPNYFIPALKVLASRSWGRPIPSLDQYFKSEDPLIRQLALKILIRNPLKDSLKHFENAANDADSYVRTLAMQGIGLFSTNQSLEILQKGLGDAVWEVRLAAANALKSLGDPGKQILSNQKEGVSQEVAKYVLTLG